MDRHTQNKMKLMNDKLGVLCAEAGGRPEFQPQMRKVSNTRLRWRMQDRGSSLFEITAVNAGRQAARSTVLGKLLGSGSFSKT